MAAYSMTIIFFFWCLILTRILWINTVFVCLFFFLSWQNCPSCHFHFKVANTHLYFNIWRSSTKRCMNSVSGGLTCFSHITVVCKTKISMNNLLDVSLIPVYASWITKAWSECVRECLPRFNCHAKRPRPELCVIKTRAFSHQFRSRRVWEFAERFCGELANSDTVEPWWMVFFTKMYLLKKNTKKGRIMSLYILQTL